MCVSVCVCVCEILLMSTILSSVAIICKYNVSLIKTDELFAGK